MRTEHCGEGMENAIVAESVALVVIRSQETRKTFAPYSVVPTVRPSVAIGSIHTIWVDATYFLSILGRSLTTPPVVTYSLA